MKYKTAIAQLHIKESSVHTTYTVSSLEQLMDYICFSLCRVNRNNAKISNDTFMYLYIQ